MHPEGKNVYVIVAAKWLKPGEKKCTFCKVIFKVGNESYLRLSYVLDGLSSLGKIMGISRKNIFPKSFPFFLSKKAIFCSF